MRPSRVSFAVALAVATSLVAVSGPARADDPDPVGLALATAWNECWAWFDGDPSEGKIEGKSGLDWLRSLASPDGEEAEAARSALGGDGDLRTRILVVGVVAAETWRAQVPAPDLLANRLPADRLALERMLGDRREWMRIAAAWRLAEVGTEVSVPALVEALGLGGRLGAFAAAALVRTGATTPAALDALARVASGQDEKTIPAAAVALLRLGGQGASRFVAVADAWDKATKQKAWWFLTRLSDDALVGASHLLGERDWNAREWGATLLTVNPRLPAGALAAVVRATGDDLGRIRWLATWALGKAEGPLSSEAVAALEKRLSDEDEEIGAAAAVVLAKAGKGGERLIPHLLRALSSWPGPEDRSDFSRLVEEAAGIGVVLWGNTGPAEAATDALVRTGPTGLSALVAALPSGAPRLRRNAVPVLATFGESGRSALRSLLGDADEKVTTRAALALLKAGEASAGVLRPLLADLHRYPRTDDDDDVFLAAVEAAGEKAAVALADLLGEVKTADDPRLRGIAGALIRLGPKAAPAMPAVLAANLDHVTIPTGRTSASEPLFEEVIRAIGAAAAPALAEAIDKGDEATGRKAVLACNLLGPDAKDALPALRRALAAGRLEVSEGDLRRIEAPRAK